LLVGFVAAAAAALDFGFLALDLGFAAALDLGLVDSTLDFFFGGAMVQKIRPVFSARYLCDLQNPA